MQAGSEAWGDYHGLRGRGGEDKMNHNLANKITKILVLSYCEAKKGRGDTSEEIQNFEERSIAAYLGRVNKDEPPYQIAYNLLHARVNRDVALILKAIQEDYEGGEATKEEPAEWTFTDCPSCGHPFIARDKWGLFCCMDGCEWSDYEGGEASCK